MIPYGTWSSRSSEASCITAIRVYGLPSLILKILVKLCFVITVYTFLKNVELHLNVIMQLASGLRGSLYYLLLNNYQ